MTRYDPVTDYLMHYGRKGMKWGKHIYGSNKNGTSDKGPNVRFLAYERPDFKVSSSPDEAKAQAINIARSGVRAGKGALESAGNAIGSNLFYQRKRANKARNAYIQRQLSKTVSSISLNTRRAVNHVAYLANRRIDQITHRKTGQAIVEMAFGGTKTSVGRRGYARGAGRLAGGRVQEIDRTAWRKRTF